jgi:hypothetical protein
LYSFEIWGKDITFLVFIKIFFLIFISKEKTLPHKIKSKIFHKRKDYPFWG